MSAESIELSGKIIATLLDMKSKASVLERKQYDYVNAMRREFEARVANDPQVKALTEEARSWDTTYRESLKEVFTPGTIVRIDKTIYVVSEVENSYIYGFEASVPAKKTKRAMSLSINNPYGMVCLGIEDITDKKLCRVVENLIARIRMKDW